MSNPDLDAVRTLISDETDRARQAVPPLDSFIEAASNRQRRNHRAALGAVLGAAIVAGGVSVTVQGSDQSPAVDIASSPTTSSSPTRPGGQVGTGSRPFAVNTLQELIARSDEVVVGRVDKAATSEPADDEAKSGLTLSTFPLTVGETLKGHTRAGDTIDVSVLPVRGMEREIAMLEPGKTYVVFSEKTSLHGEARFVPIGGMGVYEVHADGSLHRVEDAPDKPPRKITSLDELRQISD